jgi:hypothetical protein
MKNFLIKISTKNIVTTIFLCKSVPNCAQKWAAQ